MMWFHIPLQEAYSEADKDGDSEPLDVGQDEGGVGYSEHNGGMFYNGIKASFEVDDDGNRQGWGEVEKVAQVKVLCHGHCHNTDRCRRVDGIW
jgi:hypothetical protein